MINNDMDSDNTEKKEKPKTPNEAPSIYVRGMIKISDPETGQTILETSD
jgi:hypothetical protein